MSWTVINLTAMDQTENQKKYKPESNFNKIKLDFAAYKYFQNRHRPLHKCNQRELLLAPATRDHHLAGIALTSLARARRCHRRPGMKLLHSLFGPIQPCPWSNLFCCLEALSPNSNQSFSTGTSEAKYFSFSHLQMVRKRLRDAKTGLLLAKPYDPEKFLKKIGLGKEDHYFWKQVGKALLCTYTLFGLAWLYNETSPLGWWTLKPRPKEERELAHLYERRKFPYPGDREAMDEFIAKGGMIGTTVGPKGIVEAADKDSYNYQKELQDKKLDQEAQKLWFRMRNEVIAELQEKGFDVE